MKSANIMKAIGSTVVLLLCALNVQAQSNDASAPPSTSSHATKAQNRALAKKVHHALARAKGLDPTHISVKVVSGAVTLTGSCESQDQIDLAGKAAQGVDGVTSVSNKLTVRAPA